MTGNSERISEAVIHRLPRYYRYLEELERDGETRVSSAKMSRDMGLNASQIRRDLNCFGGFGQQGYGYSVSKLKGEIAQILGIDKKYKVIIVGAGNLGHALLRYPRFKEKGFYILGLFDNNKEIIDNEEIFDVDNMEAFIEEHEGVDIGVICTPKTVAQNIADRLAKAGVKGIWNFAPQDVKLYGIPVENVHLNDGLYVLCFRLNSEKLEEEDLLGDE